MNFFVVFRHLKTKKRYSNISGAINAEKVYFLVPETSKKCQFKATFNSKKPQNSKKVFYLHKHFGFFWHQKMHPFWSFQAPEIEEAFFELKGALIKHILAFSGIRKCTLFGIFRHLKLRKHFLFKRSLNRTYFGLFRYQKLHLFGGIRHLIFGKPFWS